MNPTSHTPPPPPPPSRQTQVRVVTSLNDIKAETWDTCVAQDPSSRSLLAPNPFLLHSFLSSLEDSGCVRAETSWLPQHLVLEGTDGHVYGVMPFYLKGHSLGEYVFDHAWADAFERAGGQYYPKLLSAIPFTPVTGSRLCVHADTTERERARQTLLAAAAIELAKRHRVSSLHINFLPKAQWNLLANIGYLQRKDRQFFWQNDGYRSFDDFLTVLAARKRKAIRRERRAIANSDLTIDWQFGTDICDADWNAFFSFYMDTGARKWGTPYLNRKFFSLLSARMPHYLALVMARRGARPIAGALHILGAQTLFGRYWGCTEHVPFLHFELCYYQAIDLAIARDLSMIEAGAQGEHKLARGYLPQPTYSAHWIADAGFRDALERYLEEERKAVALECSALAKYAPFKQGLPG